MTSPTPFVDLRHAIQRDFDATRLARPRISLRGYARILGVDAAFLSLFLRKRRNPSQPTARKLLQRLDVPETVIHDPSRFARLDLEKFSLISEWHYFAILSMTECGSGGQREEDIAAALRLPPRKVRVALTRLLKLDLVRAFPDGRFLASGNALSTPDGVPSECIRRNHAQTLQLALRSLRRDPLSERNFSNTTIAIDPALLPEAIARIDQFTQKLSGFLERGSRRRVYKLAIQMFPLSHSEPHAPRHAIPRPAKKKRKKLP